jgi:recombination protein RecT
MTAQTVSQAVATRESGPVKVMWSRKRHFDAVLPASVDVEAFLGTAAGALYASDVPGKKLTLMTCAQANPDSLIIALMACAALGHMPGTDEYYLTPRLDHGHPKVLGIEGYRGVIERMYRSGAVAKVVVREVCERDYFDYREGEMDIPVHRFATGTTGGAFFSAAQDRGQMVGGYSYAQLTNGSFSRVVILTRDDIFAARDSGGYKPDDSYSPWNRLDGGSDHPEFTGRSMWWKTLAKRLEPWVPTSREYRREMLRASAAASEQAKPRAELSDPASAPALVNGHADIVDADIVDDASAGEPAALDGTAQDSAPDSAAASIALGRLEQLLQQVPLGTEGDKAEFIAWVTGHPAEEELTPGDVKKLTARLDGALKATKGNGELAAAALWEQHKQATGGKP